MGGLVEWRVSGFVLQRWGKKEKPLRIEAAFSLEYPERHAERNEASLPQY
jgi:hypothetical protein